MTTIRWSIRWCMALAILSVSGCASAPVELNYYLLHSPDFEAHTNKDEIAHKVHVQQLVLPDYLKQRSLVIQTSAAKLHFSARHVWAEPLQNGLAQALSESLWDQANILTTPFTDVSSQDIVTISLHIDDFLPTYQNQVVLKGKYYLDSDTGPSQVHLFDFRLPLKQDGFEHSVNLMRKLVIQLSEDIANHLEAK